MLRDLLSEVAVASYLSRADLARKLNQPSSLIEDGLERLIRFGYLQEDVNTPDCTIPCGNCPYARLCQHMPIRTISVTEKGRKLLEAS